MQTPNVHELRRIWSPDRGVAVHRKNGDRTVFFISRGFVLEQSTNMLWPFVTLEAIRLVTAKWRDFSPNGFMYIPMYICERFVQRNNVVLSGDTP